jgi:toxin CcdB
MAQFDVYELAPKGGEFRLVADLQSGLLDTLLTRLVAPVYPLRRGEHIILRLNPILQIGGERYYLATQEMAAVRVQLLGTKVAALSNYRDEIISAIDCLITGV